MIIEKINNYLTIYTECTEEEIKKYFQLIYIPDKVRKEGQSYSFNSYVKKYEVWLINCGNKKYKAIEVRAGQYVNDYFLGMNMYQIKEGLCESKLDEVELMLDIFIECIRTYMAVCCNSTSNEIKEVIKKLKIANRYNQCIETDDKKSKYKFDNGFVTVSGDMAKYMGGEQTL